MMLSLLLLLVFSLHAEQDSVVMRSLKDVSSNSIDLSQPAVFMVFQKDCSSCHKQVKDLACLNVPVYLLGAFASEKSLRSEYRKMPQKYPAFLGDRDILQQLGVQAQLSPQLVLTKDNKRKIIHGLTPCEEINKAMKEEAS